MKRTHFAILLAGLMPITAVAVSDRERAKSDNDAFVDPGNTMARSYADEFGVSLGEATRRLKQQNRMRALRAKLLSKHPNDFAGLYALNRGNFKVVAKFKGSSPDVRGLDPELASDLETQTAERSLAQLQQDLEAIVSQHGSAGIDFNVAIDEPTNGIDLYVTSADALNSAVKDGRLKVPSYVRVRVVPSLLKPTADVQGGRSYLQYGGNYCTTGFTLIHATTKVKGGSTAGHCIEDAKYHPNLSLSVNYNSTGGSLVTVRSAEQWIGNNMDLQRFTILSGTYPNTFWDGSAYVTVTGTVATSVGDFVCKFGRRTQRTCGTVEQYNYWSAGYGYVTKVVGSGPINDEGDSGGPVFKGSLAAGWVHAKDSVGNLYYTEAYMPESKGTGYRVAKGTE